MKTLKEVRQYLNNVPNINAGGCAISALALSRWIKKNRKGNPEVYFNYLDYNKHIMEDNLDRLKLDENILDAPSHCVIKYKNKFMDSTGVLNKKTADDSLLICKFNHKIPNEKLLINTINNISAWNRRFNRKHIKDIAINLNISLKEIRQRI